MRPRGCAALVGATLLVSTAAFGQDEPDDLEARTGWKVNLSPYAWLVGVEGKLTVDGQTEDVKVPFSDFLDLVNAGFQIAPWAQKGPWTIAADLTLADLGLEESALGGVVDLDFDLDQIILTVKGGYRVFSHSAEVEPVRSLPQRHRLDLVAGFRYWSLDSVAEIVINPPIGPSREIVLKKSDSWTDPLIGLAYLAPLSRKVSVKAGANVGGFGLGSGSRFTWEAALLFTHVTTKHWAFTGGYRALFWDRKTTDDGSTTRTELTMHGPLIGATYSF